MKKTCLLVFIAAGVLGAATGVHAQARGTGEVADEAAEQGEATANAAFERRFRWGLTGGGGPMVGDFSGFGVGLAARFGMQINPLLGVYAQPSLLAGVGARADIDGAEATAAGLYGLGVLGDVTLLDTIYLAAGPELLLGGIGSAEANVDDAGGSANVTAATGPFFSLATRAGFVFGTKRPDRRSGFSIGLDMHAIFAGDDMVMLPLVFLGYDSL